MSFDVVVRTIELVGNTPAGSACMVAIDGAADVDVVALWCAKTGNEILAVHPEAVEVHRGRIVDPIAALPADRRLGTAFGSIRTSIAISLATTAAWRRHHALTRA